MTQTRMGPIDFKATGPNGEFDMDYRLSEATNQMSQAGLVAVGVLAVNQVTGGGSIQQPGDQAETLGGFFFVGVEAQVSNLGPQVGTQRPVSQPALVGCLHPLDTRLMMRQTQVLSFKSLALPISGRIINYNRQNSLVKR
jgi:hypothetical protein